MKLEVLRYRDDKKGNFSLTFALLLLVISLSVGTALDISRAVSEKQKLQNSMDIASLAAAKLIYQENGKVSKGKELANEILSELTASKRANCDPIIAKDNTVTLKCLGHSETIFPGITPKNILEFNLVSVAQAGYQNNYEVSFVFDISDSMNNKQVAFLENALHIFTSSDMFKSKSDQAVFSLIPFANTVTFDSSYSKWLDPHDGYKLTPNYTGCFTRETTDITKPFTGSSDAIAAPMRAGTMTIDACPPQSMAAKFFNKDIGPVSSMITNIKTTFGTGTADALTWGYRSLHPDSRGLLNPNGIFPRDFAVGNKKILILMTDGKPLNQPWVKQKGGNKGTKAYQAEGTKAFEETCKHIENKGEDIDIYVIAFGKFIHGDGVNMRPIFTDCTQGKGQFIEAEGNALASVLTYILNKSYDLALTH